MSAKEDIQILDSKLTRLKVEYEQYFMRRRKREPVRLREEVERTVLYYTNVAIMNTSLKFRFSSLVAKFNAYKQYWNRTLRAIEEGNYMRRAETAPATRLSEIREEFSSEDAGEPERPLPPRRPATDDDVIDDLYAKYIDARIQCNEPVEKLSYEKFAETVRRSREKAERDYHVKETELDVTVKGGRARLAIRPKGK